MDMGGFDQSEAWISLSSRYALLNKTNIKCLLSSIKKALRMRKIKFVIPLFTRHVRVVLGSLGPPWEF